MSAVQTSALHAFLPASSPVYVPRNPIRGKVFQVVQKSWKKFEQDMAGKTAVVLGRSNVVGKPMAMLLLEKNATVIICHAHTQNPQQYCQQADIIVSAVGKAGLIQKDWVKNGACVVDVGMNRNSEGKLVGDVAFEEVSSKTSFITPVPGGVGPMTIAMLLENTIQAFENQTK